MDRDPLAWLWFAAIDPQLRINIRVRVTRRLMVVSHVDSKWPIIKLFVRAFWSEEKKVHIVYKKNLKY